MIPKISLTLIGAMALTCFATAGDTVNYTPPYPVYIPAGPDDHALKLSPVCVCEWQNFRGVEVMNSPEEVSGREKSLMKLYTAAKEGNLIAQYILADFYHEGYLVKKDIKTSIYWMTRAAEAGLGEAADKLGGWYEDGIGVEKDLRTSLGWYEKSGGLESQVPTVCSFDTVLNVGSVVVTGSKAEFVPSSGRIDSGTGRMQRAQLKVGEAYFKGEGRVKDHVLAARWFLKAASRGNNPAQAYMGFCYYHGMGVEKDEIEAYAYWNLASVTVDIAKQKVQLLDKLLSRELRVMAQQRTRELKHEIEEAQRAQQEKKDLLKKTIEDAERNRKERGA